LRELFGASLTKSAASTGDSRSWAFPQGTGLRAAQFPPAPLRTPVDGVLPGTQGNQMGDHPDQKPGRTLVNARRPPLRLEHPIGPTGLWPAWWVSAAHFCWPPVSADRPTSLSPYGPTRFLEGGPIPSRRNRQPGMRCPHTDLCRPRRPFAAGRLLAPKTRRIPGSSSFRGFRLPVLFRRLCTIWRWAKHTFQSIPCCGRSGPLMRDERGACAMWDWLERSR